MPEKPSSWGVPLHQRSYTPYMEGSLGPTDAPQPLVGHAITDPNLEQSDPVTFIDIVRRGGRNVAQTITVEPARTTSIGYTLGYPVKALWSPILKIAQSRGYCPKDIYLIPDCITDRQYMHWKVLKQVAVGPAVPADALVSNTEDNAAISYTSDITASEEFTGWEIGAFKTYTIDTEDAVRANAASFFTEDCTDCDDSAGQALVVVGGDGTAAPAVIVTEDRFGDTTTVSVGSAGDVGKDVYSTGDLAVIALYTGASFAAATAGKLFVSTDRLATTPVATGITDVIARVVGENRLVFAVGKDSTGNGVLHYSQDGGQSWTESTSSALPTGSALLDAAWDIDTQRLYVVGEDGTLLLGTFTGSNLKLVDISANLPATGLGDLAVVVVLGQKTVFVAGATGYAAESRDNGATWRKLVISGTTAITSADGTVDRLVVGAGTNIYVRDPLRQNSFKAMTIEDGLSVTGTVTSVTMGPDKDINLFVVTTSTGEVVELHDFRPS